MYTARFILIFTAFLFIACGKKASADKAADAAETFSGYHKVLTGQSGHPVYTVISMPSETQIEIRQFYLSDGTVGGTYSIDRATITKSGPAWTLHFSGSDCVADGTTVQWDTILVDEDNFKYSVSTDSSTILNFVTTAASIPKVEQYGVAKYPHDATYCD